MDGKVLASVKECEVRDGGISVRVKYFNLAAVCKSEMVVSVLKGQMLDGGNLEG